VRALLDKVRLVDKLRRTSMNFQSQLDPSAAAESRAAEHSGSLRTATVHRRSLDCPTRWGSTLVIVERSLRVASAVPAAPFRIPLPDIYRQEGGGSAQRATAVAHEGFPSGTQLSNASEQTCDVFGTDMRDRPRICQQRLGSSNGLAMRLVSELMKPHLGGLLPRSAAGAFVTFVE
jgi:hypothetical protein